MRKARRQMKEAMRKYQLSAKERVDRAPPERVSALLGGDKSFGGDMEGGRGSAVGSVSERQLSTDLGKWSLGSGVPFRSPGSAGGGPIWWSRSMMLVSGS